MTELSMDEGIRLDSTLRRSQRVTFGSDILAPDNPLLRECIGGRDALIVCSPAVERLYGSTLKSYLSTLPAGTRADLMVLHRSESTKTIDAALEVCERADAHGLRRTAPIVAVGGGVCTDICGLAAALFRRGVPHIKVPTTLIGLIDAGIGTKNAVNHRDRKSALGSFHPPEHSILDASFLASLPSRHLVNGMAEMAKMAIVADGRLFELLEGAGRELVESGFRAPAAVSADVVRRSVTGMLTELSKNVFETVDYRRKVDFGHTVSPYIEIASLHAVLHGEAVAMDMALSSQTAALLGLLDAADLDRILALLQGLGLPLVWPATCVEDLWATLPNIAAHRNGDLHLVVPTGIGSCAYAALDEIDRALLTRAHDMLRDRDRAVATQHRASSRHAAPAGSEGGRGADGRPAVAS